MNRNGNLQAQALTPAEDEVQQVKMCTWIQKSRRNYCQMRQLHSVRARGGAGEATLIDDYCANHSMHGVSHAAACMTKAAATVDGARQRDPDAGHMGSILCYTKAAKEVVRRRPSCCRVSREATVPHSKQENGQESST